MDEELRHIISILKKVFTILLNNPKMMLGCDISKEEVNNIIKTGNLSLKIMQHVAGDGFFVLYQEDLDLTKEEAKEIQEFLFKSGPYFLVELKEEIPYLIN